VKLYSRGGSIPGPSGSLNESVDFLSFGRVLGVPMPILIFLALLAVAWFVLTFTRFGRYVYAVGGNERGARVSGVPVKWVTFAVFVICGAYVAQQLGPGDHRRWLRTRRDRRCGDRGHEFGRRPRLRHRHAVWRHPD